MSTAELILIGTPIGNLDDLTPRALAALGSVDRVACEDTRRTGTLFAHHGIAHEPFIVCNDHTQREAAERVLAELAAGRRVGLVSDAGMPSVSDPGEFVVQAVIAAGHHVTVAPGPTAAVSALVLSGLETRRWCFEGFLPRKGPDRRARLAAVVTDDRTTVLYEAPHRIERTLQDLLDACGPDRRVAVARELTKKFEEVRRGTLSEVLATIGEPRGEFVIVLDGCPPAAELTDDDLAELLRGELDEGKTRRDAVAAVVAATGVSKKRVYELALTLP